MTLRICLALSLAIGAGFAAHAQSVQPRQTSISSAPPASSSAQQMAGAAIELLATLSPAERASAMFPLEGDARTNWSNVPAYAHRRPGLRVGDLSDLQRLRLHDLLRASLSSQGYQKVAGVMRLDDINRSQQIAALRPDASAYNRGVSESFGTANYSVAIFGDPRSTRWAWLIQGHHLGISFTVADDRTAFLPMFLGATPLAIEQEVEIGWSALSHEVTRGIELMQALTESQRSAAYSQEAVPGDVLNGVGYKHKPTQAEGLKATDMTAPQRHLLRALVEEYVRNADFDAAEEQLAAIEAAGWNELSFSWRGAVDDREQPFYYRVQGPRIVIECRHAESHIHTIVRDPVNDYGEEWLGLEYREHTSAAERSAAARRAAEVAPTN